MAMRRTINLQMLKQKLNQIDILRDLPYPSFPGQKYRIYIGSFIKVDDFSTFIELEGVEYIQNGRSTMQWELVI